MQYLYIGNINDYYVLSYENFEIPTPKLVGLQTTFVKLSKFSKACFLKTLKLVAPPTHSTSCYKINGGLTTLR